VNSQYYIIMLSLSPRRISDIFEPDQSSDESRPDKIWLLPQELIRYSNLYFELFERECNIINGDWTLLSEYHCRASMALLSRKMRKWIDSDGELSHILSLSLPLSFSLPPGVKGEAK